MTGWVGALAKGTEGNWTICKHNGLWGTGSAKGVRVRAGDELFVWSSGRGWLAHCEIVSDSRPPRGAVDLPWPEPERYRYVFNHRVVAEAFPPAFMSAAQLQRRTGLHTIQLGQFPRIENLEVLDHLRTLIRTRSSD